MPISKMWTYRLLFVFCVLYGVRISPARIKLVASNHARWFIGVLGRYSPILGNFAPAEARNRMNRPALICMCRYTSVPFTDGERAQHAGPARRFGCVDVGSACLDAAVPEDGCTCLVCTQTNKKTKRANFVIISTINLVSPKLALNFFLKIIGFSVDVVMYMYCLKILSEY